MQRHRKDRALGPRAAAHDHWHRTGTDEGRPYRFTTADALLADFFSEVRRVLGERGMSDEVIGERTAAEGRPR